MADTYFDTGLNCYSANTLDHSMGGNSTSGRQIDYSTSQTEHFIIYTTTESGQSSQPMVWLGWGNDDSWSSVQLCDWDDTSGVGLLMDGNAGSGDATKYDVALAIDQTHDELHVVWSVDDSYLYHAKCTNLAAPGTVGNWQTYGSDKYQRVDNSGSAYRMDIDVMEHTTYGTVFITWQENYGGGIYVNVGSGSTHAITASAETQVDSDSSAVGPAITCVHESSRDRAYIAWMITSNYNIEVKKCNSATSNWGTAANWVGPVTGTTTPDVAISNGSATNGGYPSITHWYSGGTDYEQVFVGSIQYTSVNALVYDNWYDANNYTGSGPGWVGAAYTTESLTDYTASYSRSFVTSIGGDFRHHVSLHVGTGTFCDSRKYGDTNSGSSSYTHAALSYTPDSAATGDSDTSRGQFNAERHAWDTTNDYTAFFSIDLDVVGSTADIYVVYPNEPGIIELACAMNVDADGDTTVDLEFNVSCSMNVDAQGEFDDLNIVCIMSVGLSAATLFQVPLDCAMDVDAAGSAAPGDPYQESAETTPDTLNWSVICEE